MISAYFKFEPFSYSTFLSTIKDLLLSVAAFTTIFLSLYGISKWRSEIKVKAQFDASRKIIWSLSLLRKAVIQGRNIYESINEYPKNYYDQGCSYSDYELKSYIYENRKSKIIDALSELEHTILEAQYLIDGRIMFHYIEISKMCTQIVNCMTAYCEDIKIEKFSNEDMKAIIHDQTIDGKNGYTDKLTQTLNNLTNALKPYLLHKF